MFDIVFSDVRIVNGTGNPWFYGDVGIENNRIAGVGNLPKALARRSINGTGLAISPGFIDLHTHTDFTIPLFHVQTQ